MTFGTLEYVPFALALVAVALIVRSLWIRRGRWRPAQWAEDMGLELTPRNEGFVRSYIARTRAMRMAGALLGLLAPIAYSASAGRPPPVPLDFALLDALAGYLIGAVLAEATVKRPATRVREASLVPRNLADYLPPVLSTFLRAAAGVALVLVPLYLILPAREDLRLNTLPPAVVIVPTILAVWLGVELAQRSIVGRSQPLVERDLVQADDAVRSASLYALAGAGVALELLIISVQLFGIAVISDIQLLRWTLPWISLVCLGLSLWFWVRITRPQAKGQWPMRREARA
jgi:hypothetical protein